MQNNGKISPLKESKRYLLLQKNGLTGHIEDAGYPFNMQFWGNSKPSFKNDNPNWWVYEQTAYWMDGYLKVGILLNDKSMINRISNIIYEVINNPDEDGYLGPNNLKTPDGYNRWPHVVFFRAAIALYEHNKDIKIVKAIENHYLNKIVDYSMFRDVLNVEIMLLIYNFTNNNELLNLALESYKKYNDTCQDDLNDKTILSNKKTYVHGVSYSEYVKLSALIYSITKDKYYLKVSEHASLKIDKYFMLLDGVYCSSEFMISNDVYQSHETCVITDYTWYLYYLFIATKKTLYLDKIEKAILNAGYGSVLEDFKALQYFSSVNQVIATSNSNHNAFYKGSSWMSFRPNPGTECCPGNVNRFMPNYILHTYKKEDQRLYVNFFNSSKYQDESMTLVQKSDLNDKLETYINVSCKKQTELFIRYPAWAEDIIVNCPYKRIKGFIVISIKNNVKINIQFKASIKKHFEKNYCYYTYGPFLYSLKIKEKRVIDKTDTKSSQLLPAYNIYPSSKWNYGMKENDKYWYDKGYIYTIGYEMPKYKLVHKKSIFVTINLYSKEKKKTIGDYYFTPELPTQNNKEYLSKRVILKLDKYKDTNLRISAFPIVK